MAVSQARDRCQRRRVLATSTGGGDAWRGSLKQSMIRSLGIDAGAAATLPARCEQRGREAAAPDACWAGWTQATCTLLLLRRNAVEEQLLGARRGRRGGTVTGRQQETCLLGWPGDEVLHEEVHLLHDKKVLLANHAHAAVEQQAAVAVPAAVTVLTSVAEQALARITGRGAVTTG